MAGLTLDGAYVEHDGRSVKIDADSVFTIGQNRAVTIICEAAKAADQGWPDRISTPIKVLGDHPELGGKIEVSGPWGPQKPADTTGSNGRTHPDDQKRPATLALIRRPGTPGLPKAWQRTLNRDLTLPVADDADLPEVFIVALKALIAEIKRNGAHRKRCATESFCSGSQSRRDVDLGTARLR